MKEMENWDFIHFYTYFYLFEKSKFWICLQAWWKYLSQFLIISEQQMSVFPTTMLSGLFIILEEYILKFQKIKW